MRPGLGHICIRDRWRYQAEVCYWSPNPIVFLCAVTRAAAAGNMHSSESRGLVTKGQVAG